MRDADYPNGGGPAIERFATMAQMLEPRRVALLVEEVEHPVAIAIEQAIRAAGHDALRTSVRDAVEPFFFPPDDVHMID